MPTPSEEVRNGECGVRNAECEVQSPKATARGADWAARSEKPLRSVFKNYRPKDDQAAEEVRSPRSEVRGANREAGAPREISLQSAINVALARSFVCRFLAKAYEDPTEEGWRTLNALVGEGSFQSAVDTIAEGAPVLAEAAGRLKAQLRPEAFAPFLTACLATFGHAARGRCPLNEIEYGDLKADPLFQPHRLADLAGFYRAFGLGLADGADERLDHLCVELEFMSVLAAKEAYALEHQLKAEDLAVCRDGQKKFLREHLGRWTPVFARRLVQMTENAALGGLAEFTRAFIEADCARFGVVPGSEDLLLRPVDAAAESLCASCATAQPPNAPGT